ncbi:hypothetical protein ABIB94_008816 [Bradyrhizobium sp. JR7.2]
MTTQGSEPWIRVVKHAVDAFVWNSCQVATGGWTENSYTVRMKSLLNQITAAWQRRALVLKAGTRLVF